jgi:hypothetical protein
MRCYHGLFSSYYTSVYPWEIEMVHYNKRTNTTCIGSHKHQGLTDLGTPQEYKYHLLPNLA